MGAPVPGVQVEVRGAAATAAAGEIGELWIRGPNIMLGYWNRPDATADALVDGWYRSGDIVHADERRLPLHGRPREGHDHHRRRERLLDRGRGRCSASTPTCSRRPCSASPTRAGARRSTPSVTPRPGAVLDAEALVEHARRRIAGFKVPALDRAARRAAPQVGRRQGAQEPAARALLGRPRAARELMGISPDPGGGGRASSRRARFSRSGGAGRRASGASWCAGAGPRAPRRAGARAARARARGCGAGSACPARRPSRAGRGGHRSVPSASSESVSEACTSKTASTRDAVTFACCPPGPEDRLVRNSISSSGRERFSRMGRFGMASRHAQLRTVPEVRVGGTAARNWS